VRREQVPEILTAWSAWMYLGGAAPTTIRTRVGALRRRDREQGPLVEVTRQQIAVWLSGFAKASTRSTNLSYVRCFYAWAIDEELLDSDPTRRLPKVKVPRAAPRPIPSEQLAAALARATPRERLWLELMAFAGLRVSEVALCRPSHVWTAVDGATWLLIPRGKGGHEQQVAIPGWLAEKLAAAEPWDRNSQTIYRHTKALLEAVGSTSTPHAGRHWFATAMLRDTGNLRVVQQRCATPTCRRPPATPPSPATSSPPPRTRCRGSRKHSRMTEGSATVPRGEHSDATRHQPPRR
jgi:integrase/recombinase XerC